MAKILTQFRMGGKNYRLVYFKPTPKNNGYWAIQRAGGVHGRGWTQVKTTREYTTYLLWRQRIERGKHPFLNY